MQDMVVVQVDRLVAPWSEESLVEESEIEVHSASDMVVIADYPLLLEVVLALLLLLWLPSVVEPALVLESVPVVLALASLLLELVLDKEPRVLQYYLSL